MGDGPIQSIIQPVTIDTMLNNNGMNIGDRFNFVTCEHTLKEEFPGFSFFAISLIIPVMFWDYFAAF